jgi:hypothetical protein
VRTTSKQKPICTKGRGQAHHFRLPPAEADTRIALVGVCIYCGLMWACGDASGNRFRGYAGRPTAIRKLA